MNRTCPISPTQRQHFAHVSQLYTQPRAIPRQISQIHVDSSSSSVTSNPFPIGSPDSYGNPVYGSLNSNTSYGSDDPLSHTVTNLQQVDESYHWNIPGLVIPHNEPLTTSNLTRSEYGDLHLDLQKWDNSHDPMHTDEFVPDLSSEELVFGMEGDSASVTESSTGFQHFDEVPMSWSIDNRPFQAAVPADLTLSSLPSTSYLNDTAMPSVRRRRTTSNPQPSAAGDLIFVEVAFDATTRKQAPQPQSSINGTRQKGRKGPLTDDQRAKAANMRKVGACDNCRRRRCKCDGGDPCNSCLKHYRGGLKNNPCRSSVWQTSVEMTANILPNALKWHPSEKSPASYLTSAFETSSELFVLPFNLGFGPDIFLQARAIITPDQNQFLHAHVSYEWPSQDGIKGHKSTYDHIMLPATLVETKDELTYHLDWHLSRLVNDDFHKFPLYPSPLNILQAIHRLYQNTCRPDFLGRCLKLLVLTHCSGDIYVNQENASVKQVVWDCLGYDGDWRITPCLVRGQLGPIMSEMAKGLMQEILEELLTKTSHQSCGDFPEVISAHMILAMVAETVQYHGCKAGFHEISPSEFDRRLPEILQACRIMEGDSGIGRLLQHYRKCFSGCHSQMQAKLSSKSKSRMPQNAQDMFLSELREIIQTAQTYLQNRAAIPISENAPMSSFFDRILARVVVFALPSSQPSAPHEGSRPHANSI